MSQVIIYTKPYCFFCQRAKALLRDEGIEFEEIDITGDIDRIAEMARRSGRRTVPQIFINEMHIGGSDELIALRASGELQRLIGQLQGG